MITKERVKEIFEEYTGSTNIQEISIVQDPLVTDTYAIQVKIDKEVCQFLLIHYNKKLSIQDIIFSHVEEAEFATWPPTSGELRFFF